MTIPDSADTMATGGYLQVQTAEGLDYNLEIAGIGARTHAFIIDWHFRLLAALVWFITITFGFYEWRELASLYKLKLVTNQGLITILPMVLIYFLYHPVLEILMSGRTPGKRMAGVRLVTLQGHTPGVGALLLRNVFRLVDSLPAFYMVGLVTIVLTRHQVRIGDLASGMVLVYDETIDPKTVKKMTELALHSTLRDDELSLLLDLLARWKDLARDNRIEFAENLLRRGGQVIKDSPESQKSKKRYEARLRQALEQLLETSSNRGPA
jgi:uncharacterized RDD family membrane protein YckC